MLFSDEQKLMLKGDKKGFVKRMDYMSLKNESTLRFKVNLGGEFNGELTL